MTIGRPTGQFREPRTMMRSASTNGTLRINLTRLVRWRTPRCDAGHVRMSVETQGLERLGHDDSVNFYARLQRLRRMKLFSPRLHETQLAIDRKQFRPEAQHGDIHVCA